MSWNLPSVLLVVFLCFVVCAYLLFLIWTDASKTHSTERSEFEKQALRGLGANMGLQYSELAEAHETPIPMVLYCPICGCQHVDAVEHQGGEDCDTVVWNNPPHRSHLCAFCGCIWRPADVPTEGVPSLTTKGEKDWEFPFKRTVF
jgi:hypothetical protein